MNKTAPIETEEERAAMKPRNSKGEHTQNVDIQITKATAAGSLHIFVHAITDDPKHGFPYESTGRTLLHVATRSIECPPTIPTHWQSWRSIQSDGWNDPGDVLHHLPATFHALVKTAAEAGMALVEAVDA